MSFDKNTVNVEGFVTLAPHYREDKASVTFDISSNYELKGVQKNVIIPIVSYGETAKAVLTKLTQGTKVYIMGMLRRDKEGNLIIAALEVLVEE